MKTNRRLKYSEYSTEYLEYIIYQWVRGPQNREIWRLWLIEEMTYEQIAEKLNVSDKTVARCICDYDSRVFLHMD